MPKARRAPIWVVWSRRIAGCCRMACDNLWCRMNAERRSPSRYPGKNRLAGRMAARTDQRNMASERARGLHFSLPLSCSDETTFPLSLSLSSAAERGQFYFPEILGGFVGGPITKQVWTVARPPSRAACVSAATSSSAVWARQARPLRSTPRRALFPRATYYVDS